MNNQTVTVEKGTFRTVLLPFIAVAFILAAIFSCMAVGFLFFPSSIQAIRNDLIAGQIYDTGALKTWTVVYILFTIISCLSTLILAAGMALVAFNRSQNGLSILSSGAKISLYGLNISGIIVLVYFIARAIRYVIICFQDLEAMMFSLIAFIFLEGVMFTFVCLIFFKLRHFLESCMESTSSISYMLCSGKIADPTIPPLSVSGFLALFFVNIVLGLDRFFSFSYTQVLNNVVYNIPFTRDPIHFFSGMAFCFAGLGSLLIFLYLKSYKRKCELLLFRSIKEILS